MAATPEDRDRVVDFLRAASILAVVLGHWMIATVVEVDGERQGTNALSALAWLRPVTWAFQVMPVFFLVGGFANLRSLRAGADGHADAGGFLARRADRLLRPTMVFVGVWLLLAAWLERRADPSDLVRDITRIAAQPLWFLAVFVLIVLAAPLQLRAQRARPRAVPRRAGCTGSAPRRPAAQRLAGRGGGRELPGGLPLRPGPRLRLRGGSLRLGDASPGLDVRHPRPGRPHRADDGRAVPGQHDRPAGATHLQHEPADGVRPRARRGPGGPPAGRAATPRRPGCSGPGCGGPPSWSTSSCSPCSSGT